MTCDEISPAEVQRLMQRVDLALTPWRGHPDWDDIVGEAYLGLWWQIRKLPDLSDERRTVTYAIKGAKWQVIDYLRSRRTGRLTSKHHFRQGKPAADLRSLEEAEFQEAPPSWDGGLGAAEDRLVAPQIWDWLMTHVRGRQREALIGYFQDGLTTMELGARMGIHPGAVAVHLQRGLNHYRRAHGIATRYG